MSVRKRPTKNILLTFHSINGRHSASLVPEYDFCDSFVDDWIEPDPKKTNGSK